MNIFRRAANGASALLVAFSSVLTLVAPATTYAAGQTCTWTGTAGDGKFSTATNWTGCSNAAPTNNDTITFNATSLAANTTVTNDITGLIVDGINVTGGSQGYSYTIAGSLTLNGDIYFNDSTTFVGSLTLAKDASFVGEGQFSSASTLNVSTFTFTRTTGYLFLNGAVNGTGKIVSGTGDGYIDFPGDSTGFVGTLEVKNESSINIYPGKLNAATSIIVSAGREGIEGGGSLVLCRFQGATISNPLTVGGQGSGYGAVTTAAGCGYGAMVDENGIDTSASVNWAGPITLTKDTVVSGSGDFKISGALTGAYAITQRAGTRGQVTVAASSNASKSGNGVQRAEVQKTTYAENKPAEELYVGANQEATLTGTYKEVYVTGGVLKGTGTIKGLLSVTKSSQVAPGTSPGCLTSETLVLEGTYLFELGGTEACTGYDQLKVLNAANTADAVTIDGTTAVLTTSLYDKFVPKKGQTFVIIEQGGDKAVKGTFKDLPEGATFTQDGVVFKISYVGGTGNDVTLTVQSVPATPDTGFALVAGHPVLSALTLFGISGAIIFLARRSTKLSSKA